VGESSGRESAAKATSADFADDVRSIVAWLRARPDIDPARVALAGHSEGGMIAPLVASTDPQLRAIALLAGTAYTGRRISLFQNRQSVDAVASLTPRQRDSIMTRVPAALDSAGSVNPWLGYFFTHDPLVTLRLVKQPVLVLQGLTDRQVSPEQADTLAFTLRKAGNKAVTLKTFPATNHLFLADSAGGVAGYTALKDPHVRPAVLSVLADWAVKVLK
jgi:dipeptidyl aminopeptidase/acylaminoacyl peptidase